jgi:serine/threonine protein kinase
MHSAGRTLAGTSSSAYSAFVTSSNASDPLVGRLVADRYEVVRKLNQGGVGAVYLAMQRPLDRPVALKVLLQKYADDVTAIRRFEKEAAAIARLAHAHIVTVYDFGATGNGDMYLAMELLRGHSVRELLDQVSFLPWERSLHIIIGVTRALVAAHGQGIVHRDLKPENVMLVENNGDIDFAKVLDFGLARTITQAPGATPITRHDVIPGTPAYMSPERANGISDDPRSDLYALGAMWFELLVGEPPFPGETSIKVILRHVHDQPRRPSQARRENPIPGFIDGMILRLLEKSPEGRPGSAKSLLEEIERLVRPAGWHASGAAELSRHTAHDEDLAGFSAAAATLLEDDLHFAVDLGEPMPLLRKKVPAPSARPPVASEPVLLTRRKTGAFFAPPTSATSATSPNPPMSAPPVATAAPAWSRTDDFLRASFAEAPNTAPDAVIEPVTGHERMASPRVPPRIESVAQVAGWLAAARTVREVGELCSAFLVTRFDRALVVDIRGEAPILLGTAGFAVPPSPGIVAAALQHDAVVRDLAGRREAYYGPAPAGPAWLRWFAALGGVAPGALFVGGLGREGTPAFVFYADHKDGALRPRVKDTVILLREAAGALSTIG